MRLSCFGPFGCLLVGMVLGPLGCSAESDAVGTDESALNESPKPRQGSTINSPSVNPAKKYWGSRSIERLVRVGYLTQEEAAVAKRADGIIANLPPNGSLGVDELAALESPPHSNSLFPAEKAVIPKLWKSLEMDPPSTTVKAPNWAYPLTSTEKIPTQETKVPATTRTAQRIELTCDNDGNPDTLTSTDIECAYANRASFLPAEVAELRDLVSWMAFQGPGSAPERTVDATGGPPEMTTLYQQGGAAVIHHVLRETPLWRADEPFGDVTLTETSSFMIEPGESATVILLDPTAGGETDLVPISSATRKSRVVFGNVKKFRVEVWSHGTRTALFDLAAPPARPPVVVPFGASVQLGPDLLVPWFANGEVFGLGTNLSVGTYADAKSSLVKEPLEYGYGPVIPARVYRVAGAPGETFELYASGYGRYVTNASKDLCYPNWSPQKARTSCSLLDANGAVRATVGYGSAPAPNDNPAIGVVSGDGPNRYLYPL